jgi:hypothetical protein
MGPQMARQLQELQKENARLKRLVADQALDNQSEKTWFHGIAGP